MAAECFVWARAEGYKCTQWAWHKPEKAGTSIQGGPRQPVSLEYILTVMKLNVGESNMLSNFALLKSRTDIENLVR